MNDNIKPFTVSYKDEDRKNRIPEVLKEFGVCVITDVFSPEQCDEQMQHMVDGITTISPSVKIDTFENLKETWKDRDIMPQVRKGLHQEGYSFLGWPMRSSTIVEEIFQDVYSNLRGKPVTHTITSLGSINVRPPIPPFARADYDWAHYDQTESDNKFECVQGQIVLTTTTAGFRCSPKSHLIHKQVCEENGRLGEKGDWFRFPPSMYKDLQKKVSAVGGQWQIPVIAPKGSIILWFSATIHSAKLADEESFIDAYDPDDKWKNWRGIVYCSQRPADELSEEHMKTLHYAWEKNYTTNHWGYKIFKKPHHYKESNYNPTIVSYVTAPLRIFKKHPELEPQLDERTKRLLGYN